jgi:hypothetical protein
MVRDAAMMMGFTRNLCIPGDPKRRVQAAFFVAVL